jgi:protein TonB
MSVPILSPLATPRTLPVRWPRVGALTTSFSLHGVAAAVVLLAVSAPRVELEPRPALPPLLAVSIVEPPPADPPQAPTLAPPPAASAPPPAATAPRAARPQRIAPTMPAAPPSRPALTAPAASRSTPQPSAAIVSAAVDYASVSRPPYPAAAALRGAEGEVLVRVLVGLDGRPARAVLARSSGDRDLDRAALAAVRGWRFRPALSDGAPVAAWVEVPVVFRLGRR